MRDDRDYKLDIGSLGQQAPQGDASPGSRPYLSILFACCHVYQRVYRDAAGQYYVGRCPRCGRQIQFRVGQGGTSQRFFVAR